MKKLMIAAAMVCAAAMSYGAAAEWNAQINSGSELFAASSEDTPIGGTMYLFYADAVSQEDVVTAWLGGAALATIEAEGRVDQAFTVGANGQMPLTPFTGVDANTDYFVAILASDGNLFVGDAESGSYDGITGGLIMLDESWSGGSDYDFTSATTFQETGWYAAPEPTSGLLLLIGVAGLALRRRRA